MTKMFVLPNNSFKIHFKCNCRKKLHLFKSLWSFTFFLTSRGQAIRLLIILKCWLEPTCLHSSVKIYTRWEVYKKHKQNIYISKVSCFTYTRKTTDVAHHLHQQRSVESVVSLVFTESFRYLLIQYQLVVVQ